MNTKTITIKFAIVLAMLTFGTMATAQTPFPSGIRLVNVPNDTTSDSIPVISAAGKMYGYITKAQLAAQLSPPLTLQDVTDNGSTTTNQITATAFEGDRLELVPQGLTDPSPTNWTLEGIDSTLVVTPPTGGSYFPFALDVAQLAEQRTYTLPDEDGTVALVENLPPIGPTSVPYVAFIFDDNYISHYDNIKNIFESRGLRAGFAITSKWIGTTGKMSANQTMELQDNGHEILAHSVIHQNMASTTIGEKTAQSEIWQNVDELRFLGFNIFGWVTPQSIMADSFIPLLYDHVSYGFTKSNGSNPIQDYSSAYKLTRFGMETYTAQEAKDAADAAYLNKEIIVYYMHDVPSGGADETKLIDVLDYCISQGYNIVTPSIAMESRFNVGQNKYYRPQRILNNIGLFTSTNSTITAVGNAVHLTPDAATSNTVFEDTHILTDIPKTGELSFSIRMRLMAGVTPNCSIGIQLLDDLGAIIYSKESSIYQITTQSIRYSISADFTSGTERVKVFVRAIMDNDPTTEIEYYQPLISTGNNIIYEYVENNDNVVLNNKTNQKTLNGFRIQGIGTGISNQSTIGLYEQDNATRQGIIGFTSMANSDLVIRNDVSSQELRLLDTGELDYTGALNVGGDALISGGLVTGGSGSFNGFTAALLRGTGTGISNSTILGFFEINGTVRQGYIGFGSAFDSGLTLANNVSNSLIQLKEGGGADDFIYRFAASDNIVWHSGNDGPGSAMDAGLLGGIDPGSFLRSDITDNKTAGNTVYNDGLQLMLGTGGDMRLSHNGTNNFIDLINGDLLVRDGTTTRFTFERTTGNFTATGTITAANFVPPSDRRLKKNIRDYAPSPLPIKWRTFDWKDTGKHQIGVIAQEVRKVAPEFVEEAGDGMLSVKIIDLLIAKVAELESRIKKLEHGTK